MWHFADMIRPFFVDKNTILVCQNVTSITCKKRAVIVQYKNNDFNCCFCDSYPNDIHGIKKTTNITALPDKKDFQNKQKFVKNATISQNYKKKFLNFS